LIILFIKTINLILIFSISLSSHSSLPFHPWPLADGLKSTFHLAMLRFYSNQRHLSKILFLPWNLLHSFDLSGRSYCIIIVKKNIIIVFICLHLFNILVVLSGYLILLLSDLFSNKKPSCSISFVPFFDHMKGFILTS